MSPVVCLRLPVHPRASEAEEGREVQPGRRPTLISLFSLSFLFLSSGRRRTLNHTYFDIALSKGRLRPVFKEVGCLFLPLSRFFSRTRRLELTLFLLSLLFSTNHQNLRESIGTHTCDARSSCSSSSPDSFLFLFPSLPSLLN